VIFLIQCIQLILNDASETVVASYRRRKLGVFSKARKASIEILPHFEVMLDEIMVGLLDASSSAITNKSKVTFVYVECLREKNERGA
jgi:hypothetical protein